MFGIFSTSKQKFLSANVWVHEPRHADVSTIEVVRNRRSSFRTLKQRTDLLIVEIDGPEYYVVE